MTNRFLVVGFVAILVGLLSSGCGNIDITKRRYMPGYHLELGGKHQILKPKAESHSTSTARLNDNALMETAPALASIPSSYDESAPEMDGNLTAASTAGIAPSAMPKKTSKIERLTTEVVLEPMRQLKHDKLSSALRRSVFAEEGDEKYGWSVVGIIAMALSVIAFIALLVGIVTLISGGAFWFVPLILGFIFGLVGMILGMVGVRQTKAGGKKGRAFAIIGMILGIVSFAASLIALVAGLVITLRDGNGIFGN
jgi:hypothetical protein